MNGASLLIELLIVIVILGILAAVAIPQVTKFIRSGKVSAANAELALVKTAVGAALADGQVSAVATPRHLLTGGTPTSSPVGANVNVVAYNATGPLSCWVADYIQGATGAATARSAGGNGSNGRDHYSPYRNLHNCCKWRCNFRNIRRCNLGYIQLEL